VVIRFKWYSCHCERSLRSVAVPTPSGRLLRQNTGSQWQIHHLFFYHYQRFSILRFFFKRLYL